MRKLSRAGIILSSLVMIALLSCYLLLQFNVLGAERGVCGANGDNVTWILSWNGDLTISGAGEMADFGGDSPFAGNRKIRTVAVRQGVISVGSGALRGCAGLRTITLPPGLARIGEGAFSGCTALKAVNLPAGLLKLGAGAFEGCTGLTAARLPASLTEIGENAFGGCTALTTLSFPEGNPVYTVENGEIYRKSHGGSVE